MQLTDHKTESVYRRYTIVSEVDLAEGVGRLAANRVSVRVRSALEKLEPTIRLEPMTCRLRTGGDAEAGTTQPTSDDVSPPDLDRSPKGDDHPSSS
jgi:hypothetical protein